MASPDDRTPSVPEPDEETALREILGYLNFSSGTPDVRFQQNLNRVHLWLVPEAGGASFRQRLEDQRQRLAADAPAFRDSEQAQGVIELVFDHVLPAYRRHHSDLLFHLTDADFQQPFFLARVFEATLSQGGPWGDVDRIVAGALQRLNDFLGHRPIAVLENGRQTQPYSHERSRPVPLYVRNAGVAAGAYHDLIVEALAILDRMPTDILSSAHFDRDHLDELALDVRAYDHSHPVYKRTNYTFGEWDPHCLDTSGHYRRFVIRAVILDSLNDWLRQPSEVPADERLCEAAAVLAGTLLMASSVSGSGPDTHDSNVSLTSLLPKIARQRDAFYTRLLQSLSGKHGDRLRKEAQVVQQPFGRIRQHLNLFLAHYGCRQMQRANLAFLFAHMGYADAAREQAAVIPSAATRFETEIQLRLALAPLDLNRGNIIEAAELCAETEDLLHRGIECGALVDPWNILGFQGQFPLFSAREDSVADPRVDKLLALMEQFFNVLSRLACEAAAMGNERMCATIIARFQQITEFWDRFATTTVGDLPAVHGGEGLQSASRVTQALVAWHDAGEAAGDVAFWRLHVDEFQSPRSYAIVVELLLRKRDVVAAMNLLIQWLSQSQSVLLESGSYSFFVLMQSWMDLVLSDSTDRYWPLIQKFFDYVEVNAGEWGTVPQLKYGTAGALHLADSPPAIEPDLPTGASEPDSIYPNFSSGDDEADDNGPEGEDSTFSAAYESVVFRDSAQDGHFGDTVDESTAQYDTDLDMICQPIELRLRFLVALSQSWKAAAEWELSAVTVAAREGLQATPGDADVASHRREAIRHWDQHNDLFIRDLTRLMDELAVWEPAEPDGDPESLGEYDRQLHVKFSLVNAVISACVALHESAGVLKRVSRPSGTASKSHGFEELVSDVLRAIDARDVDGVRRRLPRLLKELARLPLLYVPLDREGTPREILAARNLQSLLRLLLTRLPVLGLYRETSTLR